MAWAQPPCSIIWTSECNVAKMFILCAGKAEYIIMKCVDLFVLYTLTTHMVIMFAITVMVLY